MKIVSDTAVVIKRCEGSNGVMAVDERIIWY